MGSFAFPSVIPFIPPRNNKPLANQRVAMSMGNQKTGTPSFRKSGLRNIVGKVNQTIQMVVRRYVHANGIR